uniref:Phosphatidylinositol-3-phosphatase SAC1 n=1 Tax=Strigamia maritima TaxID=126957 RepID=T1J2C7_STRMM
MAVYQDLILHITSDYFYIEPLANSKEILVIDRITQDVSLRANVEQIPVDATRKSICGIIGIIRLLAGPYLIVITNKTRVGDVNGNAIWRIVETDIIPYSRTLLHLTEEQIQDNKQYLSMIQFMLQVDYYYFSSTYDLTHTVQRLYNTTPEFLQMPLHERADQRFVWNGHLLREWAQQPELSQFCLPIVLGYISIRTCAINRKAFTWILISRRSCFRAGTRFFMRGLDSDGHSANFVETEQIIEYNNNKSSFVQTRGSIPLFWSQKPNLRYMPEPFISNTQNHVDGFSRHFDSQIYNYGKQVIINLINQKGRELKLETALSDVVKTSNNAFVKYVAFDFHSECKNMQWHRLSLLLDQKLGILMDGQQLEDQNIFEAIYKNVWADNADICSIQYAGTGALKTDFTRTGKRTRLGMARDGINSLIRYYKNNFADGFRQDAIDLILGNYTVGDNENLTKSSPLQEKKDWKYLALPMIALMALAMCFFQMLIPAEYTTETLLSLLFWFSMVVASIAVIFHYGPEYVDEPKLCETHHKKKD